MKIYYAHPISTCTNGTQVLKKEFLAHMAKNFPHITVIDPAKYGLKDGINDKEIVDRNIKDIITSQAVVADLTVPSFGVTVETISSINVGMQTFAIVKSGVISAWITQTVKCRCSNLDTLMLEIAAWLSVIKQVGQHEE